ncbi:hypothetical protein CYMTET_54070 [Cymbomonas tetramitiformis]|uniref:Uncharacterized protein n=1 Tax=Cymbomonas tetramitiformis TaxID=36881 RepID=A0AAE0EPR0_9CHLO|nr:hypothetical protein CYMTET_54070 [Cymbomonas tetramitiformis]
MDPTGTPTENGRSRKFVPESCSLAPFSPGAYLDAIGPNRNVYIFGDSITQQQKSSLSCELERHINSTGRSWNLINGGRITFYRVSTTQDLEKQLQKLTVGIKGGLPGAMLASDVCIFNVGVHYNDLPSYKNEFLNYFERNCLKSTCLPCRMVWRESTHQHFPGKQGGNFAGKDKPCPKGCARFSEKQVTKHNWRNIHANALMEQYGVPIIRAWHMSSMSDDMHVGAGGGRCDCTHFCNYRLGLFEAWHTVFQNFLAAFS